MKTLFNICTSCFLISFLFLLSCEPKKEKKEWTAEEADSLQLVFESLNDSVAEHWNRMMVDDNQKIADAKRLLDEISYTNNYDPAQIDSLQSNLDQLKAVRYDSISMKNSESIDYYDSASNKVINEIVQVAKDHPDFNKYPLMEQLINDINEANGRVLRHRVDYDYTAKTYNQFIEENKEIIEEVDSLKDVEKKPLFELSS